MRKTFRLALLAATVALPFACTTAEKEAEPVDMEKLRTEVQAIEDAFAAAEKAKDADAVATYYADNAVSYHSNQPPSIGKAAIREYIANRIANDSTGNYSVYKVVDLFPQGDKLVEIGSFTEMDTAGAETNAGFYMSYFEKMDGKYKCVRDMSISTKPR